MSTSFRHFINEKWFEHKDEILTWTGKALTEYDSAYYFRKHRWMLKRMYKEHLLERFAEENARKIQKEVKRGLKKGNL